MTRVCRSCGGEKALDEFHKNSKTLDGRQAYCRPCANERSCAWRLDNLERQSARAKAHYAEVAPVRVASVRRYKVELRRRAVAHLGGICVRCGFSDVRALQIDHVSGGGRKELAAIGRCGIYRRVIKESADYQLLCANCNWIKRSENSSEVN
jgi:hypothetical protein